MDRYCRERINLSALHLTQLRATYDEKRATVWAYMQGYPRACFTLCLLGEIHRLFDFIIEKNRNHDPVPIRYMVIGSDVQGIYNLGCDLQLFCRSIAEGDRNTLFRYGEACIRAIHRAYTSLGGDVTTICLVQGDALGGGFEAALSGNLLIAERNAKLGFPGILLNIFPGIGTYSLVSRMLGRNAAKHMSLSGEIHSAEKLYDKGLVDILAEDSMGEESVKFYIDAEEHLHNDNRPVQRVEQVCAPLTREELSETLEIWVESALRVQKRDLRLMKRLVTRQTRRVSNLGEGNVEPREGLTAPLNE